MKIPRKFPLPGDAGRDRKSTNAMEGGITPKDTQWQAKSQEIEAESSACLLKES